MSSHMVRGVRLIIEDDYDLWDKKYILDRIESEGLDLWPNISDMILTKEYGDGWAAEDTVKFASMYGYGFLHVWMDRPEIVKLSYVEEVGR